MSEIVNNVGRRCAYGMPDCGPLEHLTEKRILSLRLDETDNTAALNRVLRCCLDAGKLVPGARVVNISTFFGDLPKDYWTDVAWTYNTFMMGYWTDPVSTILLGGTPGDNC